MGVAEGVFAGPDHLILLLYTSDSSIGPSALEDFFKTLHVPSIDTEAAAGLTAAPEIVSAIRSMQSGKSPGPDGYPTDLKKKIFEKSLSLKSLPSLPPAHSAQFPSEH